jgi:5-(aminomethyl)-3-furanmethanol phosphate kinase
LSKSQALPNCLYQIAQSPNKQVVIVPGGGDFADQVRFAQQQWLLDDVIAHEMAILAMQQMALMFKGLESGFTVACGVAEVKNCLKLNHAPVIWSPTISELNAAKVPCTWEVSSDSLAAWLAKQLNATELILLKAAAVTTNDLALLRQQGIIDAAFIRYVENADFTVQILSKDNFL